MARPVCWHGWELTVPEDVPVTVPPQGLSALLKQDGVQGPQAGGSLLLGTAVVCRAAPGATSWQQILTAEQLAASSTL